MVETTEIISCGLKTELGPPNSSDPCKALIVHITSRDAWKKAESLGVYEPPSLKSQGYIHCSYPRQLVKVANYLYKGRKDLVLLCIETTVVRPEIRLDAPREGLEAYPHIYGPLNLDSVTRVLEFKPDKDGSFQLPPSLE